MSDRGSRIAGLSTAQLERLLGKLKERGTATPGASLKPGDKPRDHDAPVPLSVNQEGIWLFQQLEPESSAYHMTSGFRIRGPLDVAALERALTTIVERHEALRTVFELAAGHGEPRQRVTAAPLALARVTLEGSLPERETALRRLAAEETDRPFDLARGPLLRATLARLGGEDHALLVTLHHIVADGWSLGILNQELAALYGAYALGRPSPLAALPVQYPDYALWQRGALGSERRRGEFAYWRRQLSGARPLILPVDHPQRRPRSQGHTPRGRTHLRSLPAALTASLTALGQAEGSTLYMVLLAAFKALLLRMTGQDDLVVGTGIANRGLPEFEPLIGVFANILALRSDLSDNPPFTTLLARVREVTLAAFQNAEVPFEKLIEELQPARGSGERPLVQAHLVLHTPSPLLAPSLPGLDVTPIEYETRVTRFDLEGHLWIEERGPERGVLRCLWLYNADVFEAATIERLGQLFEAMLEAVVERPAARLGSLPLVPAGDRRAPVERWTAGGAQPVASLLHRALDEHAERAGDAVALLGQATERKHPLSWRELQVQTNRLALHLQSLGVEPGARVAVCLDRSVDEVVAVLAVLKAGATLVALDPSWPDAWIVREVQACDAQWVLSRREQRKRLAPSGAWVVCIDTDAESIAEAGDALAPVAVDGRQPAVLYIGPDGQRSELSQSALTQRIAWLRGRFPLGEADVMLYHLPPDREAWASELLWPLVAGVRLVVAGTEVSKGEGDGVALGRLLEEHGVTVAQLRPRELGRLVALHGEPRRLALRHMLVSGEPLGQPLVEASLAALGATLTVFYAPPEVGMVVSAHTCRAGEVGPQAALGQPVLAGVDLIDDDGCPVPPGVRGEIAVQMDDSPRLVRTGDIAIRAADGALHEVRPRTRRVSIDGARVDLEAIEAALLGEPSVRACRVMARDTRAAGRELVAYVVSEGPLAPGELAARVRAELPPLCVPRAFVPVIALPLQTDGAIDEEELARIPVIDEELLGRCEEAIQALPQVHEVAALVIETAAPPAPLHLSDLLPEGKTPAAAAAAAAAPPAASSGRGPVTIRRTGGQAISQGAPLTHPPGTPATLGEALARAAREQPEHGLRYLRPFHQDGREVQQSYRQLHEEASRIAAGLLRSGLVPGAHALLQLDHNHDFLPAFWGCVLAGVVPAPVAVPPSYDVDHGTVRRLLGAWELLGRPLVVAATHLVAGVRRLGQAPGHASLEVLDLETLRATAPGDSTVARRPEDPAVVMLTSGSTGRPKGVVLTHGNLCARSLASGQILRFSCDEVSFNWMPMDHVAGLVLTHLRDVFLGCHQVLAPIDFILEDPLRWLDGMARAGATLTFAPNFAYGLINDRAAELARRRYDLSRLKFILNGGEAIVARTARRFLELLEPHGLAPTAMHPAWGMSEISSGVTYSFHFSRASTSDDDAFVEVGGPIPGVSLRIVDAEDAPVEEGVVGRLQVKGPTVMRGYHAAGSGSGSADAELHRQAFTADGWFKTGDFAFLLDGRLTITGRDKDVIIVNGVNYYSHEIESVVEELPDVAVSYTAACAVRDARAETDRLAIFFHPVCDDDERRLGELLRAIRQQVSRTVGIAPDYLLPVPEEAIPKTEIGKIQRAELGRRFAAGAFDAVLRQIERLERVEHAEHVEGGTGTVPAWFMRPTWCRKQLPGRRAAASGGRTLLVLGGQALGEALGRELEGQGERGGCVRVELGADFAALGQGRYRIDPAAAEHHRRLLEEVGKSGPRIERVIWLMEDAPRARGVESAEALGRAVELGLLGPLFLTQALAQRDQRPLRLLVVGRHAAAVTERDVMASERAPVAALVRTIAAELPWMSCRYVDLPLEPEAALAGLLAELETGGEDDEPEVAYRGGARMVPRLERVAFEKEPAGAPALEPGGVYLMSGGLGGVGGALARWLVERYRVRLILLGRTALPPREAWERHLGEPGALAERLRARMALEALGDAVVYEAADVADAAAVGHAVQKGTAHFGAPLAGAIHLAGAFGERLLVEETSESLRAMLRAKVLGAWVLGEQLRRASGGLLLAFSSVNALLGGFGVGAYAAANRFLESFCRELDGRDGLRARCLSWSMWEDVGMARGYAKKELTRQRGYHLIPTAQGLDSLGAVLHRPWPLAYVGLDPAAPRIRRLLHRAPPATQRLLACYSRKPGVRAGELRAPIELTDRFGREVAIERVELDGLPHLDPTAQPGGGIDRAALRERFSGGQKAGAGTLDASAPRTPLEVRLVAIWRELLRVPHIGIHDNFFALGGHSLLTTRLVARIRDELGISIALPLLFERPTVARLAEAIAPSAGAEEPQALQAPQVPPRPAIRPVPRDRPLPLTVPQEGMWFWDRLHPGRPINIYPLTLRLGGPLDPALLERVLGEIARRHEPLRTTFRESDGRPTQIIHPALPLPLERLDLGALAPEERPGRAQALAREEVHREFDLERGPLWHARLIRLDAEAHVLVFTAHHIIFDGWSARVLLRELVSLYTAFAAGQAAPLVEPVVQLADFAAWQRAWLDGAEAQEALAASRRWLEDAPPLLALPTDRPRPAAPSFAAAAETLALPAPLTAGLRSLAEREGCTLYMVLLAGFQALLARYAGLGDIVVGSPVAGRTRPELEGLIGMFANSVALRTDLSGNPTVRELCRRVREATLDALGRQELPIQRVIEAVVHERRPNHHPLMQVMFDFEGKGTATPGEGLAGALRFAGLTLSAEYLPSPYLLFDLLLTIVETEAGLGLHLSYSSELFTADTARRWLASLGTLFGSLPEDPERRLLDLPLLNNEERKQAQAHAGGPPGRVALPEHLRKKLLEKARGPGEGREG